MKKIASLCTILFVLLFLTNAALAQTSGAGKNINGVVKDENGAVVQNADVILTGGNLQTRRTMSGADGTFSFENVTSGSYVIETTVNGFNKQRNAVKIISGSSENVEVILEVSETRVTVTAETGQAENKIDVPQSINVINSDKILERATTFLAQVGQEEVGVNVQRTSPTIGGIFIRGLAGKNVAVYKDGIRYTNGAQRGGINTFFNLNDPTGLETVELLRGPNSAQYGSDSLGGTVNLLTRSPRFGEISPEFHGEINTAYNSADRNFGGSTFLSYGTQKVGGYVNLLGRNVGTLRTAQGIDSHAAVTRFLGLRSDVLYDRLRDTEFKQYGGAARFNFAPTNDQQISFFYERNQQDGGKRYDQLLGGDGNLISDLRNLMLDFGYLRYTKQNLGIFDDASATVSYNSQREERVNQGGQGNPTGDITHQYERTTTTGFNFFVDKLLPARNTILIGGDYYHEKFKSPAYTFSPTTNTFFFSRPRIPNGAKFDSGGLFVQDSWDAIQNRLRVSGAFRYSAAVYKVRASDSPIVNGRTLFNNDSVRSDGLSGRIGAVVRVVDGFRLGFNYSRGFRYPNMTDLGTLGLTGDGFEVDYTATVNLGGTIGTTAGADAVTTGISVSKQRREITDNYDFSARYQNKRIDTEFTAFVINLNDSIVKQALILPQGAVGQFLGDQRIITQNPNGTVLVAASTTPVLVRANYTDAKIYGFEYELEARLTRDLKFKGNYTFVHSEDTVTGLPPNIEGGTPPPTGFLSFRYEPTGKRFYVEAYSTLADKQDRISTLDLADRRTGATRTRAQIQNFFRRGACVNGLTNNPDGRCGTGDETILLATGENLLQVQNRVLGVGVNSAPLFTKLPSYAILNFRGGYRMGESSLITLDFTNIADRPYRNPSWGIDGMGRSVRVGYRFRF